MSISTSAPAPGFQDERPELEEGLRFVLSLLLPKAAIVADLSREYKAVWWCGYFQSSFDGGPVLSAPLLMDLGGFGVELFVDCYHYDDAQEL